MLRRSAQDPWSWNYDIIASQRDGRFYLRIAELNLIVEDADLLGAHVRLERAKREFFERSAALDVAVPPPRDIALRQDLRRATLPFLIKTAAVTLMAAILIVASAVAAHYALEGSLRSAAQRTGRAAIEQVIRGLEDVGRRDLTPERAERLRASLRGAVPVLKPFIDELRPLFAADAIDAGSGASR